jgi:hypothetical protein
MAAQGGGPKQVSPPLIEGQTVTAALFSEPMRVETIRENSPGTWVVGLCGLTTEKFRKVTLTAADIAQLRLQRPQFTYQGDGQLLRIGIQAYCLRITRISALPAGKWPT